MGQAKWAIRFYAPFDDAGQSISFVGSFSDLGSRFLDDIKVFQGFYEVPSYMIWYVHKDLESFNFDMFAIDLKLYMNGDRKACYFREQYRVVNVDQDPDSDRIRVWAISEDYAKLHTKLIDYKVAALKYDKTRGPEELLKEVLEENGIFPVLFEEHDDTERKSFKFEYPIFTPDPTWTVLDFIKYVAQEQEFEWCLWNGYLIIGPELKAFSTIEATKDFLDKRVDTVTKSLFFTKVTMSATPVSVLSYFKLRVDTELFPMRSVWVKHWVGSKGDTTKACFVQIGKNIDQELYLMSLEELDELDRLMNLSKKKLFNQIRIGGITEDTGNNLYIEEVSIEKDVDEWKKKTPRNVVIEKNEPVYVLPNVDRTAEYLDNEAGMLFPKVQDKNKVPNSIILYPHDRVEEAVMGPFVFGNGKTNFKLIEKDADAFRFQLPNGWCCYIDKNGNTYIQLDSTSPISIPTEDTSKVFITLKPDGTIKINKDANTSIEIDTNGKLAIKTEENTEIEAQQDVDIKSNANFLVNATTKAEIESPEIKLGSTATLGIARLNDEIKSTSSEDTTYWNYWNTIWSSFLTSWQSALTALIASGGTPAGVIAYGTAMQTAVGTLQTGIPSSLTGKITAASTVSKSE